MLLLALLLLLQNNKEINKNIEVKNAPNGALQKNTTENTFQKIHRRSLLPALGPARRYPRPRNHRKRTLIRFQTCISCTPCAAAAAFVAKRDESLHLLSKFSHRSFWGI
jgi:hypothetical protein